MPGETSVLALLGTEFLDTTRLPSETPIASVQTDFRSGRLQQGTASRSSQASISAALAVATANAAARAPSEGGGNSLKEMAQRDLDAALQLLADRAQYITGSSGAAIALRRSGKNDMLCRASAGSNAPELGALLSTEFGLSGDSVRTRQLLRCDDTERDPRVNREACRSLGIASVAVMPVVNDDEVMGVFELFSGKVNAFGERDLTALKRLSQMVETAVKLAQAAEQIPEPSLQKDSVDSGVPKTAGAEATAGIDLSALEVEAEFVGDAVLPQEIPIVDPTPLEVPTQAAGGEAVTAVENVEELRSPDPPPMIEKAVAEPAPVAANRPMLWSIALDPNANAMPAQTERGQVPATLRNLHKCQACGFPVSPGRTLCVECEEKKWRGQLSTERGARASATASTASAAAVASAREKTEPRAAAAKDPEHAKRSAPAKKTSPEAQVPAVRSVSEPRSPAGPSLRMRTTEPELVLTAAMQPSQSWIASHKLVILVLLAVTGAAAVLLLR